MPPDSPPPAPCATPVSDLRASALRHYDELATAASCWMSVIPRAINAYYDTLEADSSPPPVPSPTTTPGIPVREVSTRESNAMAAAGTFYRCSHGVAPFACTCGASTPFQGYWTGESTSRVFVEVPPFAPPASDAPAPPRETTTHEQSCPAHPEYPHKCLCAHIRDHSTVIRNA